MKDDTIICLVCAICATAIALVYDGEIALLVAGALVGGSAIGAFQRVKRND